MGRGVALRSYGFRLPCRFDGLKGPWKSAGLEDAGSDRFAITLLMPVLLIDATNGAGCLRANRSNRRKFALSRAAMSPPLKFPGEKAEIFNFCSKIFAFSRGLYR
jgi:hypothetical protein